MATIAQCIGLKSHEVDYICKHLGHTEEVHKIHYRHTLNSHWLTVDLTPTWWWWRLTVRLVY